MSKIMAFILCALLSCWGTKSEDKSSVRSQDLSGNDRNEGEQNLQNICIVSFYIFRALYFFSKNEIFHFC